MTVFTEHIIHASHCSKSRGSSHEKKWHREIQVLVGKQKTNSYELNVACPMVLNAKRNIRQGRNGEGRGISTPNRCEEALAEKVS